MNDINSVPSRKNPETQMVLFPKGPLPVSKIFQLNFHGIMKGKKSVIGRYSLVPLNNPTYQTFVREIKPWLNRNYSVVPGTRTAFVLPKSSNVLEFAVAIDYDKAKTFFQSATELKLRGEILPIEFIRLLLKTQLEKAGVEL